MRVNPNVCVLCGKKTTPPENTDEEFSFCPACLDKQEARSFEGSAAVERFFADMPKEMCIFIFSRADHHYTCGNTADIDRIWEMFKKTRQDIGCGMNDMTATVRNVYRFFPHVRFQGGKITHCDPISAEIWLRTEEQIPGLVGHVADDGVYKLVVKLETPTHENVLFELHSVGDV